MVIDCNSCTVRGAACTDCVVTFLTIPVRPVGGRATGRTVDGTPRGRSVPVPVDGGVVELDEAERTAIDVLAEGGLVPPLRLATG
jgi:hypothetical protein